MPVSWPYSPFRPKGSLSEKWLTQEDIVNRVNDEAGKQVVSKSSINRFIQRYNKERTEIKSTSSTKSFERIATALERIADSLEKLSVKL